MYRGVFKEGSEKAVEALQQAPYHVKIVSSKGLLNTFAS